MSKAESFVTSDFSGVASITTNQGCPFVTVENGIINIDNRITLSGSGGVTAQKDGVTFAAPPINWGAAGRNNVKQYVASSNSLYYVCLRGYYESRIELIYEKIGGKNYYGFVASSGNGTLSYQELSAFPIYEIDGGVQYRHRPLLDYTCQTGQVDYAGNFLYRVLTKNSTGTPTSYELAFADPNLLNCTNISSCVKVTINNKNYYSLGKNWLFPIDE